MRFDHLFLLLLCVALAPLAPARAQNPGDAAPRPTQQQSDTPPAQRLEVMRQRLEALRRSVTGALAGLGAEEKKEKESKENKAAGLDDPRTRLKGLEKESSSLLSDVSNLRGKQDRAEKYDTSELDRLEASLAELSGRVETALRETAGARSAAPAAGAQASSGEKKKKRGFFGRILGRGGDEEYQELISGVAPGRDRQLFEEAAKYARKSNYETARLLFNVIITTYPDSNYLPLAKLAIADSFYLEGTTSALIQSIASYRDWLTFFPTDPLADDVMLKMAEAEMRQMGLADRDVSHARKAEQQLKVVLQQFPKTSLRPDLEKRLREVQENLGMHNLQIARFYFARSEQGKGGLKGSQSRLLEITQKYPNFSYMDEVLFLLGTTYMQEEEPDEAAKYYTQIVRDFPNSEYAEKAKEQLGVVGSQVPDADPIKEKLPPPQRPGFFKAAIQEVIGSAPVTINKNGVLISKDDKDNDLLQEAINRGGNLPAEFLENPERRPPARPFGPTPVTSPANRTTPVNAAPAPNTNNGGGVTVQPARPGPPAGTTPGTGTPAPGTAAPATNGTPQP